MSLGSFLPQVFQPTTREKSEQRNWGLQKYSPRLFLAWTNLRLEDCLFQGGSKIFSDLFLAAWDVYMTNQIGNHGKKRRNSQRESSQEIPSHPEFNEMKLFFWFCCYFLQLFFFLRTGNLDTGSPKSRWSPDKNSPSLRILCYLGWIRGSRNQLPRLGGSKWATKKGLTFCCLGYKRGWQVLPSYVGMISQTMK